MLRVLILGFIAGGLFTNGVPHFVKGITGQAHATPWGKPSSALHNVLWGWLNILVAVVIWHFAPMSLHPRAAFVAVALGVLLVAASLSHTWSKHPEHNR